MLNVMLSMLLVVAQALLCGPGCQPVTPGSPGSDMSPTAIAHGPGVGDALADLGHVALEVAFSGVVQVSPPPASRPLTRALDC